MEVHSYVPDARIGLLSVIIKVFLMSCWRMPRDVSLLPAVSRGCTPFWYRASVGGSFRLLGMLRREGFPLNSIIRQWNYIERITAFDGQDQHYQAFNNARSGFYSKTEWTNGYPAATGIGANLGGIFD